jgi:hypothetical protein
MIMDMRVASYFRQMKCQLNNNTLLSLFKGTNFLYSNKERH